METKPPRPIEKPWWHEMLIHNSIHYRDYMKFQPGLRIRQSSSASTLPIDPTEPIESGILPSEALASEQHVTIMILELLHDIKHPYVGLLATGTVRSVIVLGDLGESCLELLRPTTLLGCALRGINTGLTPPSV